ncbi:MAG: carboxypeptidase regulatory-like domain-containing protein [Candidatus Hydrogenedentes bacterium]|nr:carboxypeptidase regulatory-like domain-containing protein [Candidatus Hydrogenedentota bacterium]
MTSLPVQYPRVRTSKRKPLQTFFGLLALLTLLTPAIAFAQAGATWIEANSSIPWGGRNGHTSIAYNGKMWVFGGFGPAGGTRGNDVWSSPDGITWSQVTPAAAWGIRQFHTALVFNSKMWVIGGEFDAGVYYNDVWSSTDGITWTPETTAAQWTARGYHMSVVFGGKMWVIGGLVSSGVTTDIWNSTDGATWTLATDATPWGFRSRAVPFVHGGKIWIAGGNGNLSIFQNDVWNSSDGVNWAPVTTTAAWSPRNFHSGVVYNGKMWILGGKVGDNLYTNDVWSSTNGADWTQVTSSADWAGRFVHSALVYANKMWVIGGFGNPPALPGTEVWYSGTASLRGSVIDAVTTAQLECAAVRVYGGSVDRLAFADKNGAYRLDDLANGSYTLETFAPGYATFSQNVTITTPAVYYQNLPLSATSSNGSVHGQVTDAASGKPLAGVKVGVLGSPGVTTITCADGRYELAHLAAKNSKDAIVTLQFAAANYAPQSAEVTVPSSGSAQVDMPMVKSGVFPGALTGTVISALTSAPISGAEVTIVSSGGLTTTTDPSGVYQFSALPQDVYTVQASAPGYSGDSQFVDVSGPEPATTDFSLAPQPAHIQGDINGDQTVNAVDVQLVINQALAIQTGYDCDINKDAAVNAVDVQMVINAALGVKNAISRKP